MGADQTGTNNRTGETVEYLTVIRVKLPSSSEYHSGPSGDTEYECAYRDAIFKAKPSGFEVKWQRANERWPVDSEGYTYVPLYLTHAKDAVAYWMEEHDKIKKQYDRLKERVSALVQPSTTTTNGEDWRNEYKS